MFPYGSRRACMYDRAQFQDRCRGALLGGAIGDALGAPFEGSAQTSWPHHCPSTRGAVAPIRRPQQV
jgi:hypothetical protein